MLVQQILAGKTSADVTTITASASISDAASVLSAKRIGALVVSEDGKAVAGILSERDIVRELGKRGPTCMSDKVRDLMTRKIVSCAKEDRTEAVLETMSKGRFRHLPVMENGVMVGLISIGDVVQARLSEMSMENEALEGMIKGF